MGLLPISLILMQIRFSYKITGVILVQNWSEWKNCTYVINTGFFIHLSTISTVLSLPGLLWDPEPTYLTAETDMDAVWQQVMIKD